MSPSTPRCTIESITRTQLKLADTDACKLNVTSTDADQMRMNNIENEMYFEGQRSSETKADDRNVHRRPTLNCKTNVAPVSATVQLRKSNETNMIDDHNVHHRLALTFKTNTAPVADTFLVTKQLRRNEIQKRRETARREIEQMHNTTNLLCSSKQ